MGADRLDGDDSGQADNVEVCDSGRGAATLNVPRQLCQLIMGLHVTASTRAQQDVIVIGRTP